MSVLAKSLITLTQFKPYLADYTGGTKYDTLFELLIDGVSEAFNQYVARTLAKTTYTAVYLDGNGKARLFLPNWPIISVASIAEDGIALTEGEYNDYLLYKDEGILLRASGYWSAGPKMVLLTYTAGYVVQGATPSAGETALPADLGLACMMQVAREWKKGQLGEWGMTSKSTPDGATVARTEAGLMKEVREILDHYRRFHL